MNGKAFSNQSSPIKPAISTPSTPARQKSPKRCQFATSVESSPEAAGGRLDKCTTWLCRRGAAAGTGAEEPEPERAAGPSTGACDDATPPPKNCYRLVMLGTGGCGCRSRHSQFHHAGPGAMPAERRTIVSARAGKTSLVSRFLGNKFEDSYTPTIEDFHRKLYRIRGEIYQLDLLDTSGNHPFPAMRRLSFLTGDLFVLVFAMDSRESFEEVIRLRDQILETKASASGSSGGRNSKRQPPRVPMVIAGNKCDKDIRTVHPEEAAAYCSTQDSNCVFVETSAKKNYRVDDLYYELFVAANLPLEMAPNHHKRVNATFGSPSALPPAGGQTSRSKKCTLSIKRRLSDACGVVAPNVRRPSIRTDLMIMRTKANAKGDSESASSSPKMTLNRLVRPNGQSDKRTCAIQ